MLFVEDLRFLQILLYIKLSHETMVNMEFHHELLHLVMLKQFEQRIAGAICRDCRGDSRWQRSPQPL